MALEMEKLVSLCKRRGFLFQSSEIYGGLNGFWDYGPLGVELKRNVKEAWWRDMVSGHDDLAAPPAAPEAYEMCGLDCTIIMHPQIWKCSGHYDLFHDWMQTCRQCKKLFRSDHVGEMLKESPWVLSLAEACGVMQGYCAFDAGKLQQWAHRKGKKLAPGLALVRDPAGKAAFLELTMEKDPDGRVMLGQVIQWAAAEGTPPVGHTVPCPNCGGDLTEPREFNLMFETHTGAIRTDESKTFLRPETAQGIFVNFKNVLDSTRVRIPFGIAQQGKSFRNEITPRNFTFRSREFEQMEIEFFCHPGQSLAWYKYWRDRRYQWYLNLGLAGDRLRLRDHDREELSHYSCGTADIEYAFPFLPPGEFGELEGIAHRGDFDLRSHMEGKLVHENPEDKSSPLVLELNAEGKPRHKGSGKDLSYFDDITRERYVPHVIEPSAGADRATLAFLCEAYQEDNVPDDKGNPRERVFLKLHPRLAPVKAAVFPLVKKDGMPEIAENIYRELKKQFNVFYDEKGAVGRRYARQDEVGTPFCITVDSQTLADQSVTFRDRNTLRQWRVNVADCLGELTSRLQAGAAAGG